MLFEQPLKSSQSIAQEPCVFDFARNFNRHFKDYGTVLEPGADEPFYQASRQAGECSVIFSTQDYFSSALHELAHWCIAGEARRKHDDYGYWYEPDGRSKEQQSIFYQVEQKPQALEWAFSLAANIPFRISLDNLKADHIPREDVEYFRDSVYLQLNNYFANGFPTRAQRIISLLCCLYRHNQPIRLPQKLSCLI
ncbi:elongation factor P hydroxylase [Kangiella sediminilitoris]|uniref:Diaminobutyrate-2-oxoglutarate aminotransferase n=1 Tax=Kangiella sediminilitoris TaxID=1144748 RepID=A0A1B3B9S5_9GAMM|nr:elongation factor P hydroxylase [Kangiella sediminilitoris]AOE49547.1 hypothetical protein KS2013_824 [Kangiella sediminilitoris]